MIEGAPPPKACGGGGCLFDLDTDRSESNNLINDTKLTSVVTRLKARLAQVHHSPCSNMGCPPL